MKATIEVTIIRKYTVDVKGYDDAQDKAKLLKEEADNAERFYNNKTYSVESDVVFVDMNF